MGFAGPITVSASSDLPCGSRLVFLGLQLFFQDNTYLVKVLDLLSLARPFGISTGSKGMLGDTWVDRISEF